MVARLIAPEYRALDSSGVPLSGAKMNVYEAGTTTPINTYSDTALSIANANPVVSNSVGIFGDMFVAPDDYKYVLTDSDDVTIDTRDNITIVASSTFSGGINTSGETEHLINAQTGTSYTILDGDRAKLVTHSNASAIAVTLPQANASTFEHGWYYETFNKGAGTVTITPTTSTINGLATFELPTNCGCTIVSDETNYQIQGFYRIDPGVNAQTGTSYTIVTGDLGKNTTFSNVAAIAVTLPQANTTTFKSGWWIEVENVGAGKVTVTPATSTIAGGAATLVLTRGQKAKITSDGTNYNAVIENMPVGTVIFGYDATAPYGYLVEDGGTIGSAGSSATIKGTIYEALYQYYWDNVADSVAAVAGGRGGSATADFNADKNMTIPDSDKLVPYGAGTTTTGTANGAATVASTGSIAVNAVTLTEANLPSSVTLNDTGCGNVNNANSGSQFLAGVDSGAHARDITVSLGSGTSFTPTGSYTGNATSVDQLGRAIYWYIKY